MTLLLTDCTLFFGTMWNTQYWIHICTFLCSWFRCIACRLVVGEPRATFYGPIQVIILLRVQPVNFNDWNVVLDVVRGTIKLACILQSLHRRHLLYISMTYFGVKMCNNLIMKAALSQQDWKKNKKLSESHHHKSHVFSFHSPEAKSQENRDFLRSFHFSCPFLGRVPSPLFFFFFSTCKK